MEIQTRTLDALSHLDHYNRWLIEKIEPFLGNRILEVGSGIGNMAAYLLDRELIVTSDIMPEYREALSKRFADKSNVHVVDFSLDNGSGKEEIRRHAIDTVICVNVLEHIEDDRRALQHMADLLPPGGRLIILVPALRALYGALDVYLHHFRRYEKKELRERFEDAGLRVDSLFFFNFFGIFGWFLNARVLRREILPPSQLRLFNVLAPGFRAFESIVPIPIGQSLIIAGTKR
jgi:SAM-dependent methyltransferase